MAEQQQDPLADYTDNSPQVGDIGAPMPGADPIEDDDCGVIEALHGYTNEDVAAESAPQEHDALGDVAAQEQDVEQLAESQEQAEVVADTDDNQPDQTGTTDGEQPEAKPLGEAEDKKADAEPAATESNSPMIPKFRFDEVRKKAQQLEERLKQYEQNDTAEPETEKVDLNALRKNHYDAILDGDVDKAVQIEAQIDEIKTAQLRQEFSNQVREQTTQTQTTTLLDDAVAQAAEAYPELNSGSGQYNQKLVDMVNGMMAVNQQAGKSQVESFVDAVEAVADIAKLGQEPASAPQAKPKPSNIPDKMRTARQQPPRVNTGEGANTSGEAVFDAERAAQMTEEEFDALPASTLHKMLGIETPDYW